MRIELDPTSLVPPYEQIREQVAEQSASGELIAGTRLPTVRRLAADLGLAVNTVARAYRELETAGVIVTRGRLGTFVSDADQRDATARQAAADYAAQAQALGLDLRSAQALVRAAYGR